MCYCENEESAGANEKACAPSRDAHSPCQSIESMSLQSCRSASGPPNRPPCPPPSPAGSSAPAAGGGVPNEHELLVVAHGAVLVEVAAETGSTNGHDEEVVLEVRDVDVLLPGIAPCDPPPNIVIEEPIEAQTRMVCKSKRSKHGDSGSNGYGPL